MRLNDVMDELGAALDTITGLRVFPYTANRVTPPAAVVALPEEITYDTAYARGGDRIELPVFVLVGRVSDRASRDVVAGYADGSGSRSVKAAVEGATYASCDSVRVTSVLFEPVTVADVEYLSATFTLDVIGAGDTEVIPPTPTYVEEVLDDDPLVYLRMNETEGSTAADASGNDIDGTYVGGPTLGVEAADDNLGTAVTFDGDDDYLDATTLGTFGSGMEDGFTVEFWFRHTTSALAAWCGFLNDGANSAFLVFVNSDANGDQEENSVRVFFRTEGASGSDNKVFTNASLNDGDWHHFVLTATPSSGDYNVRIDKVNQDSTMTTMTGFGDLEFPLAVAANNSRSDIELFYPGDLDEFAIYTTALSATRTDAHFDAAFQ